MLSPAFGKVLCFACCGCGGEHHGASRTTHPVFLYVGDKYRAQRHLWWQPTGDDSDEEMPPEPEGITGLIVLDLHTGSTTVLDPPYEDGQVHTAHASFGASLVLVSHHDAKASTSGEGLDEQSDASESEEASKELLALYDYQGTLQRSVRPPVAGLMHPEEFAPPPVVWAPSGAAIAMRSHQRVVVWSLEANTLQEVSSDALHLAWSMPGSDCLYLGPSTKQTQHCELVSLETQLCNLPVQQSFFWARGGAWGASLAVLACSDECLDNCTLPCDQLHLFSVRAGQLSLQHTLNVAPRFFACGSAEASPDGVFVATVISQQARVIGLAAGPRLGIVHLASGRLTEASSLPSCSTCITARSCACAGPVMAVHCWCQARAAKTPTASSSCSALLQTVS